MIAVTSARPSASRDRADDVLGGRAWMRLAAASATEEAVRRVLAALAERLGPVVAGRAGATEEVIAPRQQGEAHRRSLSAVHGLGALPLHVELSHRPRPCRYILLGCLDAGSPPVATTVLDRQALGLGAEEEATLRSAPVLVRAGRRSFYSTVLPPGGEYMRYDRGCMEPLDGRGRAALELVEARLAGCIPHRHEWRQGDILVIDNWRALHGRDPATATAGRRLVRILIDG